MPGRGMGFGTSEVSLPDGGKGEDGVAAGVVSVGEAACRRVSGPNTRQRPDRPLLECPDKRQARQGVGKERVSLRLLIQRLGRQLDTARPDNGSGFGINRNLGEVGGVVQRRKNARPPFSREVDIPSRAVALEQAEHAVTEHGDADDDRQVVLLHALHACHGVDAEQRLTPPRSFPFARISSRRRAAHSRTNWRALGSRLPASTSPPAETEARRPA
jgi:hypothetical protein